MAKVKIQGHASGSGVITVTAPNTNTDRTITLPDETATLSTFDPDGAVVINDAGADVDFRVESDGEANMLVVDGGNNAVGIGVVPEAFYSTITPLRIGDTGGLFNRNDTNVFYLAANMYLSSGSATKTYIEEDEASWYSQASGAHEFFTAASGTGTISATKVLDIKADGRGLSQFTALAHAAFSGTGTPSFWGSNSHNFSSISDQGTGNYNINFANNMTNTNYDAYCSVGDQLTGHITGRTTSYVQVAIRDNNLSITDTGWIGIAVFNV